MGKGQIFSWQVTIPTIVSLEIGGITLIALPNVENYFGYGMVIAGVIVAVSAIVYHLQRHHAAKSNLEEILLRIAKLCTSGVNIRNEGMALDEGVKLEPWVKRVNDWEKGVINEIARISKHDAEYFKTLNLVPAIDFKCPILNKEHLKALREHNERIQRLEKLIQEYKKRGHLK